MASSAVDLTSTSRAMGVQRAGIPLHQKLEVLQWIDENGGIPSRAAAHFKSQGWRVNARMCRRWWGQRDKLREEGATRAYRVAGGGRKPVLHGHEAALVDLIAERRIRKEKVTRQWIAEAAIRFGVTDFVGSDHWISCFMKRNGLSLRRVTNVTTLDDDVVIERAVSYMAYLQQQRPQMDPSRTILMDETAVYFDDPRMQTVEETGAQHVIMHSTGFQSMRITAVLAVTAAGQKLTPLLIWKGKSQAVATINGCWVAQQPCAWVNQGLLTKWMDRAFPLLWMDTTKHIVWDSMRAHTSKIVKEYCSKRHIAMTVIPGGMTSYLQAGDIGIYKSFKDHMSGIIDEWKRSDQVQYTRGGNPKPPSVEVVAAWVRQAWRAVSDDVVANSIKKAGFSDSVEDWHIASHDVYGEQFFRAWDAAAEPSLSREELELCEAVDDITLIDA